MNYLLDTHVCLWAFGDYKRISPAARQILEQEGSNLYISQLTLLEIAIKLNIGKLLDFKISMPEFILAIEAANIKVLPVRTEHITAYSLFDYHAEHRDPFDRYLVAVTYTEQMTIITCDEKFNHYIDRINIIW